MYALSQWLLIGALSVTFLSAIGMVFRYWPEEAEIQTRILPTFAAATPAETVERPTAPATASPVVDVPPPAETRVATGREVAAVLDAFESTVTTLAEAALALNDTAGAAGPQSAAVSAPRGEDVATKAEPRKTQPVVAAVGRMAGTQEAPRSHVPSDESGHSPASAAVTVSSSRPVRSAPLAQSLPVEEEETVRVGVMVFSDEVLLLLNVEALTPRQQHLILQRLILSPDPPTEERLLDTRPLRLKGRLPYFHGRILTADGEPVRYPQQARAVAKTLLARAERVVEEDGSLWLRVKVPLVKNDPKARKLRQLERHVVSQARRYGLPPELVMGIIEVESAFKPRAVSPSGALGLMQIRPSDAGRDIEKLFNRRFSRQDFFDPYLNIEIGTAYLNLLKSDYLAQVRHPVSREYLAIAAYNGGINRVLKHFGPTPEKAIARINRMTPGAVYRAIRYHFPYRETRHYLEKVVRAKKRYEKHFQNLNQT